MSETIVLRGLQRVRPGVVVEATREETVALDDGLPEEVRPLSEDRRPPSYTHIQTGRSDAAAGRVVGAGVQYMHLGSALEQPIEMVRHDRLLVLVRRQAHSLRGVERDQRVLSLRLRYHTFVDR